MKKLTLDKEFDVVDLLLKRSEDVGEALGPTVSFLELTRIGIPEKDIRDIFLIFQKEGILYFQGIINENNPNYPRFVMYRPLMENLRQYHKILQIKKKNIVIPVETQSEIKWEDITIKFRNEFDTTIKIKDREYNFDYEKIGFADKRTDNQKRTKAKDSWAFLRKLSMANGELPLEYKDKEKIKKQKQELVRCLKALFPAVKEEPFGKLDPAKNVYKIKIKLIPEKAFRKDYQDKDIYDENNNSFGIQENYNKISSRE